MESFDKTTVIFLQKNHFPINVLKFFLDCIPNFDTKIAAMNNKVDNNTCNPKWDISTRVPYKTLIT